eukprot:1074262-Prymnesium_polylepis.1
MNSGQLGSRRRDSSSKSHSTAAWKSAEKDCPLSASPSVYAPSVQSAHSPASSRRCARHTGRAVSGKAQGRVDVHGGQTPGIGEDANGV